MYKDKDTNRYLADIWVPVKDEPSALEYFIIMMKISS